MKTDKDGSIQYTEKELRRKMKNMAKKLGHKSIKAALEHLDKEDPLEFGYVHLGSWRFLLGEDPGMKRERKECREKEQLRKKEWDKVKGRILDSDIIPVACREEKCTMCGAQANKKVEEVLFHDDPTAFGPPHVFDKICLRHPFTAHVCIQCFKDIMNIKGKNEKDKQ